MLIPTLQDILDIIGKLKDLKRQKTNFGKAENKKAKKKAEAICEKMQAAANQSGGKGWTSEELLSQAVGEGKLARWAEGELLNTKRPTSELQRLSDELIPGLCKSGEIQITDEQGVRTKEGRRLDELSDTVRAKLKRRTEIAETLKQGLPEAIETLTTIKLLRGKWPQPIQCLIDEIDILLSPWWNYVTAEGSWGADEQKIIEAALKSAEADGLEKVIHELKKVRRNMEVESKQKQRPTEGEQKKPPAETPASMSQTYRQRIADGVENLIVEYGQIAVAAFAEQIEPFNKYFTDWQKAPDEYPNPLRWEGQDKLCCYYATLAVIHDVVKGKSPVYLAEGLDPTAGGLLLMLASKPKCKSPYGEDGLDSALKYVRADIRSKAQANEGQGSTKARDESKPVLIPILVPGARGGEGRTKSENDGQGDSINEPYIKKGQKVWEFGFRGKTVAVDAKLKGLVLIEHLLLHKNKEYTPLELLKAVGQRNESETESEKMYTAEEIKKITGSIEGLKGRVKLSIDPEEKDRLEREIEQAEKEVHKARNCRGKPRKTSEKHRLSVSRKIDTVLNKISPENPALYNHLDTFLKRGEICSYKPDSEIVWDISKKSS